MASNLENNTNLNSFFEEEYSSLRHYIKSKIIFGFGAGNSQSQNKKRFNVNPCSSMRKVFLNGNITMNFGKMKVSKHIRTM